MLIMRPFLLALLVASMGCGGRSANRDAATQANRDAVGSTIADRPSGPKPGLRQGLYLGAWNDAYITHWLAIYVNRSLQAVTYDPPDVHVLCGLTVDRDSVAFTTGVLTYLSTSDNYTLSFRGALTATSMSGTLQMIGRPFDGRTFPILFTHQAIDTATTAGDSAVEGRYLSVRGVPQTGDILGEELLLIKGIGHFIALYTTIQGAPDGPYPADSLQIEGDRVVMVAHPYGAENAVKRLFLLTSGAPVPAPATSPATPSVTPLQKTASVPELFAPSRAVHCPHATPSKRVGD